MTQDKSRKSWMPPEHSPAPTPSVTPLAPAGLEASFERTREAAAGVDPRDVSTFTGTPTVVLHNVRTGATAVVAERGWFEQQPDGPRVDFARVESAVEAAEALVFAASRAARRAAVKADVRKKIAQARTTLEQLRVAAAALQGAGVVSELPPITGVGPTAVARDCAAYASFFRTNRAKTRNLTAVTPELIGDAAKLGAELLAEITPKGAPIRRQRSESEKAAADLRDRLAVVVAARYDYVERCAGWRWGAAAPEHVPALLARDAARGAPAEEELLDEKDEEALDEETSDEDEAGVEGVEAERDAEDAEGEVGEDADAETTTPVASKVKAAPERGAKGGTSAGAKAPPVKAKPATKGAKGVKGAAGRR